MADALTEQNAGCVLLVSCPGLRGLTVNHGNILIRSNGEVPPSLPDDSKIRWSGLVVQGQFEIKL